MNWCQTHFRWNLIATSWLYLKRLVFQSSECCIDTMLLQALLLPLCLCDFHHHYPKHASTIRVPRLADMVPTFPRSNHSSSPQTKWYNVQDAQTAVFLLPGPPAQVPGPLPSPAPALPAKRLGQEETPALQTAAWQVQEVPGDPGQVQATVQTTVQTGHPQPPPGQAPAREYPGVPDFHSAGCSQVRFEGGVTLRFSWISKSKFQTLVLPLPCSPVYLLLCQSVLSQLCYPPLSP